LEYRLEIAAISCQGRAGKRSEVLDNPQTEEKCRQYIRESVARVRGWLREKDGDQG
jgi:hypothetical protein